MRSDYFKPYFRCSSCYHADKFQRAHHLLAIPEAKIHDIKLENSQLIIKCKQLFNIFGTLLVEYYMAKMKNDTFRE